jgi:hypothetical protein
MSFKDLPLEMHGRIGDFIDLGDRSRLRLVDRFTSDVYKYTKRASFRLKQRYTFTDLQFNDQIVGKSKIIDISVLRNSSMVGTTDQLRSFLDSIYNPVNNRDMYSEIQHFLYARDDRFLPTFRIFLRNTNRNEVIQAIHPGFQILHNFFYDFVTWHQSRVLNTPRGISLFGVEELQELIRQKLNQGGQFPVTFIKINDVDLLDYPRLRRDPTFRIKSIKDFIYYFQHEVGGWEDDQLANLKQSLIDYLNVPNEDSSIDGLRNELRFRIKHEINVELL